MQSAITLHYWHYSSTAVLSELVLRPLKTPLTKLRLPLTPPLPLPLHLPLPLPLSLRLRRLPLPSPLPPTFALPPLLWQQPQSYMGKSIGARGGRGLASE